MLIDFRDWEEGERNIDVREKHQLIASPMHSDQDQTGRQPTNVPRTELEPTTLWYTGQHSNQLSHASQGKK